jgi:hypothetical protein
MSFFALRKITDAAVLLTKEVPYINESIHTNAVNFTNAYLSKFIEKQGYN